MITIKEAKEKDIFVIEDGKIEETTLYDHVMESVDETTTPLGVAPRFFVEKLFNVQDRIEEENDKLEIEKEEAIEDVGTSYESEEEAIEEATACFVFEHIFLWDIAADFDLKSLIKHDIEDVYVISTWGVGGNNYKEGTEYYSSEEAAEDKLFDGIYEYDFIPDDQRDTCYYETEEEAKEILIEQLSDIWNVDEVVVKSILHHQDCADKAEANRSIKGAKEAEENKKRVEKLANVYAGMINKIEGESYKTTAGRLSNAVGQKIESRVFHRAVKIIRM